VASGNSFQKQKQAQTKSADEVENATIGILKDSCCFGTQNFETHCKLRDYCARN